MFKLFKKKVSEIKPLNIEDGYSRSYTLATVHLSTVEDFKTFCEYGYNNRMVIDYAISSPEHWKTIEPITGCFAIINYVPRAGMGRYIRVVFRTWDPLSQPQIAEIMRKSLFNYNSVAEFVKDYAPDMIYRLLTCENSLCK